MTKWDIPSHQQTKREKLVISIDAKQAFDKIQHPCMIKSLSKLGTESNFLKLIKIIYQKIPTVNFILSGKKFETISKISYKAKMPPLSPLFQHCNRSSVQCTKARKGNKKHIDWIGKMK